MLDFILVGFYFILFCFIFLYFFRLQYEKTIGLSMVFLKISMAKKDSKEDSDRESHKSQSWQDVIGIMEHFFTALTSVYSSSFKNKILGQVFVSFEYVVMKKQVEFYVVAPKDKMSFIEKQISAYYPDAFTDIVDDYNIFEDGDFQATTELKFSKNHIYPIAVYTKQKNDPLNDILNSFSKFEEKDKGVIQMIVRPNSGKWKTMSKKQAKKTFKGETEFWLSYPFRFMGNLWDLLFHGTTDENMKQMTANSENGGDRVTPMVEEQVKAIEEKSSKSGYDCVIRLIVSSPDKYQAQNFLSDLNASFAQYSSDTNSFICTKYHSQRKLIKNFIYRTMSRSILSYFNYMIFSTEELASLYHFPSVKWNESSGLKWQEFKVAPAPANTPQKGILLGINSFRGVETEVHMKNEDRMRHFYLIGKSGTGKSTMIKYMIKQDLQNNKGVCVIDPHGDLIEDVLPYIPKHRADDVIIFDPGDLDRPLGINILEGETWDQKEFASQEALAIFIKMFGEEIMGPRLQHYFRNGALTLMSDEKENATILDIPRLFIDDAFQKYKASKVTNPIVKSFWENEMAKVGAREKAEIIPYFSAKFGPFMTNNQIRNIIGQQKSSFDFRKIMDEEKILLVNLSKGKMGDLNSQLVGMILVAKLQMAAMSRGDMPEEDRKDFFMYVDEFQNFVTDSFATILSEARKYRLGLVIAHQYISQIAKMKVAGKGVVDDSTIKDAVFGNVGTMMCFKIGADDAESMAKEFAPVFTEQDVINIANFKAYLKLNIDNATSRAFSMNTIWDKDKGEKETGEAIRQLSRLVYAREREFVEREISHRLGV